MRAILVIGLPGSGKTYLANTKYKEYKLIDDPSVTNVCIEDILCELENIVICDPNLCDPLYRNNILNKLAVFGYTVEEVYFENSPLKALKNIKARQYTRDSFIEAAASFNYRIPKNTITLSIYEKP